MRVQYLNDLITRWVPRSTKVGWLDPNSRKYELVEPLHVRVDGKDKKIPKGYIFDQSSIPRLAWLVYPPGTHEAVRPSAYHDYCYSHLYNEITKGEADQALRDGILAEGGNKVMALTFYYAVKFFGRGGWSRSTR